MKSRAAILLSLLVTACGGDDSGDGDGVSDDGPAYILGSLAFGVDSVTSYVSVLDSLDTQAVDYDQAHEFAGTADVWVHDGSVYVTSAEDLTITRYTVEDGALVAHETISFAAYGLTDFGFWLNTFVAPDKAYFLHDAGEYIVWNPRDMVITGTVALPVLPPRQGFKLFPGYADRAARVRDGKLYQPLYWTDESYFQYQQDSHIAVFDVATDTLDEVITAPCPGLDYASADAAGNLFFSSWVYAPGAAVVLGQPSTCVFEVPADGRPPAVAFQFAEVADGREGAALRFLPGGQAMFSAFHDERFTVDDQTDPSAVTFGPNWRFWTYDVAAGTAAMNPAFEWNAGAQYAFDLDQRTYMLVAAGDYSATTLYDLGSGGAATPVLETRGWSVRLFKLR